MEQSIYKDLADDDLRHSQSDEYENSLHLPISENHGDGFMSGGDTAQRLSARDLAEWRWANVDNLDLFLRQVYSYYVEKGFYCIILAWAVKMGTILFVVIFSSYLYSCLDYGNLKRATKFADIRVDHCLAQVSWMHYIFLWFFGIGWTLKVFQYCKEIRTLWEIHDFYYHLLHISEDEIQTISWKQIVDRIMQLRSINGASYKRLDAHNIVNRIMRQENYMIAMYNRNVLDLEIELPFTGDRYEFLTQMLEWSISMCLEDYVFNERGHIRSLVLREDKRDQLAESLKRRFQFTALLTIVTSPLLIFYMTVYYFFRYFNAFYSKPKDLGIRQYTPLAEWKFRELNELFHLFKRRISMSYPPADRYISLFPRIKTELIVKFGIFIFSSFAAVLVIITIYDPDLLNMEVRPGQNVFMYLTTLGFLIAICRAMLSNPQEQAIYQSDAAMRQIVEFTHYMPDDWANKLHTEPVKNEFTTLYDLKPRIVLRELLSVFLNPVILWFKLADRSGRIIDFFRESSIHVEELGGYVCSLAVFNNDHQKRVKARTDELDRFYATQDGKMLKSYLNFMDIYGPQSKNMTSVYASNYGDEDFGATYRHQASQSQLQSNMENSVMGNYDRMRNLPTVSEEPQASTTDTGGIYSESDDEDESIADDGVLGLLNNLYKK